MRILLVNPPVYDFTAYDFWLKPYGLLSVAGYLRDKVDFRRFDYLDRLHPFAAKQKNLESDRWGRGRFYFEKVSDRQSWDFALVSVALAVVRKGDQVADARVVFGGVAPVPWRSKATEKVLRGQRIDAALAARAADAAVADADPLEQNGYKVPLLHGAVEESLLAV